jgi:hypothetical protein
MPNRLAGQSSPYLLQHKDNPVDWYPWGEEALEKARNEIMPIFLSLGYAACHWCHVMEHESFEDPETAAIMNEHFVSIKVDREERPDLDGIYMDAVVTMTGQGGWPMSVFLTPDGKPFYGGTYFPPVRRYNMPSFKELLQGIAQTWQEKREEILDSGVKLVEQIQRRALPFDQQEAPDPQTLGKASLALAQSYDWKNGGWGSAPKFPQPMAIHFLLQRAAAGDKMALDMATHALKAMARGGMYDVVGGGFARYSVDDNWLVPHFEKMLYDNAQLAREYLHAYLLTREPFYRRICEETLDFVLREMTDEQGGFYSSLDADSEGEEGKFYVWTLAEIEETLSDKKDAAFFVAAYGVTPEGNFEGRTVLQRALDDEALAEQFGLGAEEVQSKLDESHSKLLAAREKRVRPATDDKALVSWNGLMLAAFAEAARYLKRPDYLEAAKKNAAFLLGALQGDGRLLRSWREGKAMHNGYLEDYAGLILGLLSLYQSDPDPRWFAEAVRLAEEMIAHFSDPSGGFFDTRDDHEELIVRPKDLQDNATPSGNALAAAALLQLAAYTGKGEWHDLAVRSISALQSAMARYPSAFAQWLTALDLALDPPKEIAVVGDPGDKQTQNLVEELWSAWRPSAVAAISDYPPAENAPLLLKNRELLNGKPTAYVCQNFVCLLPVNTAEELAKQLGLKSEQ